MPLLLSLTGPFVCLDGCSQLELTLHGTWRGLFLSDGEVHLLQPLCFHCLLLFQKFLTAVALGSVRSGLQRWLENELSTFWLSSWTTCFSVASLHPLSWGDTHLVSSWRVFGGCTPSSQRVDPGQRSLMWPLADPALN